ncbi:hypothetical protein [Tabrizicola sp. M-4]|uniref:hypothetical protein n=1 Tax=Tabrizicola sp. M-4 TaxID=3055847 RepID=UPI003DA7FA15
MPDRSSCGGQGTVREPFRVSANRPAMTVRVTFPMRLCAAIPPYADAPPRAQWTFVSDRPNPSTRPLPVK